MVFENYCGNTYNENQDICRSATPKKKKISKQGYLITHYCKSFIISNKVRYAPILVQ